MATIAPYRGTVRITWKTMADGRVRSAHAALQDVEATAGPYGRMPRWPMGAYEAKYPGDPALPAALRVNCRCWLEEGEVEELDLTIGRPAVSAEPAPPQIEVVGDQLAAAPQPSPNWFSDREWSGDDELRAVLTDELGFPMKALDQAAARRGLRLELNAADDRSPSFSISIYRGDAFVGAMDRKFMLVDDRLVVSNELFSIAPAEQGQGLGVEMLGVLDDWYRSVGVQGTSLHANIDVGGYVWAKAGYDWEPRRTSGLSIRDLLDRVEHQAAGDARALSELADLRRRFDEAYAKHSGLAGTALDRAALAEEGFPMPVELAMVGYTDGAESWAGKRGLLGSSWRGLRWFT